MADKGFPVETPCVRATRLAFEKLSQQYPVRIGHGWIDKTYKQPHRWLEYQKDDKWRVIDMVNDYGRDRGWTVDDLGYIVRNYEYPNGTKE